MLRPPVVSRVAGALALVVLLVLPARAQAPGDSHGAHEPAAAERPAPQVGAPYGRLHLPTVDGLRTVTLAGLRGRPLLLVEFASW